VKTFICAHCAKPLPIIAYCYVPLDEDGIPFDEVILCGKHARIYAQKNGDELLYVGLPEGENTEWKHCQMINNRLVQIDR